MWRWLGMEEKSRGYCNGHVKLVTAVPSDLLCQNPSNFCCRRNQWPAQPPQTPAHFPGLSPHRGSPSLMPATWVPSYSFPCSAPCQSWGPTPASSLSLCSFSIAGHQWRPPHLTPMPCLHFGAMDLHTSGLIPVFGLHCCAH